MCFPDGGVRGDGVVAEGNVRFVETGGVCQAREQGGGRRRELLVDLFLVFLRGGHVEDGAGRRET